MIVLLAFQGELCFESGYPLHVSVKVPPRGWLLYIEYHLTQAKLFRSKGTRLHTRGWIRLQLLRMLTRLRKISSGNKICFSGGCKRFLRQNWYVNACSGQDFLAKLRSERYETVMHFLFLRHWLPSKWRETDKDFVRALRDYSKGMLLEGRALSVTNNCQNIEFIWEILIGSVGRKDTFSRQWFSYIRHLIQATNFAVFFAFEIQYHHKPVHLLKHTLTKQPLNCRCVTHLTWIISYCTPPISSTFQVLSCTRSLWSDEPLPSGKGIF